MGDRKPGILIVDDEENILNAVALVLGTRYDVATAHRGDKALSFYRRGSCDLTVSDVRMPGMDGLELFREVKKLNPGQKFVFLSVSSFMGDGPDNQVILQKGADGFLGKPCRMPELLALIERDLGWLFLSPFITNAGAHTLASLRSGVTRRSRKGRWSPFGLDMAARATL